jgi:superfamily II DNA or RNA helicase
LVPAVEAVLRFFQGFEVPLPALIFVRQKSECELLALSLSEQLGEEVEWVTGDLDKALRADVKARFIRGGHGGLEVVVATSCWETGLDVPRLRSVVVAAGGSAPIGAKQRPGRGTRKDEESGKDGFIVYDLALKRDKANQQKRQEHYNDLGFEIGKLHLRGDDDENIDIKQQEPTPGALDPDLEWLLEEDAKPAKDRTEPGVAPTPQPAEPQPAEMAASFFGVSSGGFFNQWPVIIIVWAFVLLGVFGDGC